MQRFGLLSQFGNFQITLPNLSSKIKILHLPSASKNCTGCSNHSSERQTSKARPHVYRIVF
uniref:Uncharacterized protein n=1 Tax=Daphnia magna TaxID=35525 RepID=A0A0P6HCA7_9CRUS